VRGIKPVSENMCVPLQLSRRTCACHYICLGEHVRAIISVSENMCVPLYLSRRTCACHYICLEHVRAIISVLNMCVPLYMSRRTCACHYICFVFQARERASGTG
jgi:hypothetical protein